MTTQVLHAVAQINLAVPAINNKIEKTKVVFFFSINETTKVGVHWDRHVTCSHSIY
jgi:hypothetical protein